MRLVFAIFLILPITLACSHRAATERIAKGEALIAYDMSNIILLEQFPDTANAAPPLPPSPSRDYILIQTRDIKHFASLDTPAISRKGHYIAKNQKGQILVYVPAEKQNYTLNSTSIDEPEIYLGGYGISTSGENAFRLAISRTTNDGKNTYLGKLIEFDLNIKRDTGVATIFELDEAQYKIAEDSIHRSLSLPVRVSESGDAAFYCSQNFQDFQPSHDHGDTSESGSFHDSFVKYDFYCYKKDTDEYKPWYGSYKANAYIIDLAGASSDGSRTLFFSQRPNGTIDLLVQSEAAAGPDVIVTDKSCSLFQPRLSPEGGRAAYFRKLWRDNAETTEAVVVTLDSRSENVPLRLWDISDAMWADDLRTVVYISKSPYSSLVKDGNEPALSHENACYLHIVTIDNLVDTATFRAADGVNLRIVDVLAGFDKFTDKSDDKQIGSESNGGEKKRDTGRSSGRRAGRQGMPGPGISTN